MSSSDALMKWATRRYNQYEKNRFEAQMKQVPNYGLDEREFDGDKRYFCQRTNDVRNFSYGMLCMKMRLCPYRYKAELKSPLVAMSKIAEDLVNLNEEHGKESITALSRIEGLLEDGMEMEYKTKQDIKDKVLEMGRIAEKELISLKLKEIEAKLKESEKDSGSKTSGNEEEQEQDDRKQASETTNEDFKSIPPYDPDDVFVDLDYLKKYLCQGDDESNFSLDALRSFLSQPGVPIQVRGMMMTIGYITGMLVLQKRCAENRLETTEACLGILERNAKNIEPVLQKNHKHDEQRQDDRANQINIDTLAAKHQKEMKEKDEEILAIKEAHKKKEEDMKQKDEKRERGFEITQKMLVAYDENIKNLKCSHCQRPLGDYSRVFASISAARTALRALNPSLTGTREQMEMDDDSPKDAYRKDHKSLDSQRDPKVDCKVPAKNDESVDKHRSLPAQLPPDSRPSFQAASSRKRPPSTCNDSLPGKRPRTSHTKDVADAAAVPGVATNSNLKLAPAPTPRKKKNKGGRPKGSKNKRIRITRACCNKKCLWPTCGGTGGKKHCPKWNRDNGYPVDEATWNLYCKSLWKYLCETNQQHLYIDSIDPENK